jgi:hypothetical protein
VAEHDLNAGGHNDLWREYVGAEAEVKVEPEDAGDGQVAALNEEAERAQKKVRVTFGRRSGERCGVSVATIELPSAQWRGLCGAWQKGEQQQGEGKGKGKAGGGPSGKAAAAGSNGEAGSSRGESSRPSTLPSGGASHREDSEYPSDATVGYDSEAEAELALRREEEEPAPPTHMVEEAAAAQAKVRGAPPSPRIGLHKRAVGR